MVTTLRYFVAFILFSFFAFFSISLPTTFALSPETSSTESSAFQLNLTLGKRSCQLEAVKLTSTVIEKIYLQNYNSEVFRVPDSCTSVLSRLRADINETLWLGLSVTNDSDWLPLHQLSTDQHQPLLDKRGRYLGCRMPEDGFHTCKIGVELNGQHYKVFIPFRVGVIKTYGDSTIRHTTNRSIETITTSIAPTNTQAIRYGRGISIPDLSFYSSITTFPLQNGTWQIAVEEPLVGHLQGTAWINDSSNIVLGGHSQHSNGANGIFAGLYNVNMGQEIILNDGETKRYYVVTEIRIVHYQDVSIVYPTHGDRLTMLTCHIPSYNQATHNYDQRLVVIAQPIS